MTTISNTQAASIGLPTLWFNLTHNVNMDAALNPPSANGFSTQIAVSTNDANRTLMYIRCAVGTTWRKWDKIYNAEEIHPTAVFNADVFSNQFDTLFKSVDKNANPTTNSLTQQRFLDKNGKMMAWRSMDYWTDGTTKAYSGVNVRNSNSATMGLIGFSDSNFAYGYLNNLNIANSALPNNAIATIGAISSKAMPMPVLASKKFTDSWNVGDDGVIEISGSEGATYSSPSGGTYYIIIYSLITTSLNGYSCKVIVGVARYIVAGNTVLIPYMRTGNYIFFVRRIA